MTITEHDVRRTALNLLIFFVAGVLAGLVFWMLHEHAPALPWPALVGLLGIVLGENLGVRVKNRMFTRLGGAGSDTRPSHHAS